jgi:putative two-component system response regulator
MKILVAEDDRIVSHLLCEILREEGYRAVAALDQMQTIILANKPPVPDLIVLNLNMADGSGGETLNRLRNSTRTEHIPVIVLL